MICPRCRLERLGTECAVCGCKLVEDRAIGEAAPPGPIAVGRYQLQEQVGSGGMGVVWKAFDPELRRTVALKLLHADMPDAIRRLQREAQLAARLRHPNIAMIYDVGVADGQAYIAMEFVDGQSAEQLSVPARRAAEIVRDAARAVHHANGQDVIHRDLKPGNLMIDRDGRVVVMDFGLAKEAEIHSSLSMSGAIMGTPSFMSPEQARGDSKRADARSDVWGLGATLYALLTGVAPFEGDSPFDVLSLVVGGDPVRPRTLRPRLPGDLETIVLRCLEKDPARRYESGLHLAEDLDRWLRGEPILARPPSASYRAAKFARKHAKLLAAGAIVLVAAVAAAIWTVRESRKRADIERERSEALKREQELRLYAPLEAKLDVLRMKFYGPDYALTDDEAGKYAKFESDVREHMAGSGERAQGWYLIGRCREVLFDFEGAVEAYERAIALDARHAGSLFRRGRLELERAFLDRSVARIEKEQEDAVIARAEKGAGWVRRGAEAAGAAESLDRDLAEAYLRVIIDRDADMSAFTEGMLAKWRGEPFAEEFLLLHGQPERIREGASKLIESIPSFAPAYFYRGFSLLKDQNLEGAASDFDRALKIHPRYAEAHFGRGYIAMVRGDMEAAGREFDRAIAHRKKFAEAYVGRGYTKRMKKDLPGAVSDYTRAIEFRERYANAYSHRGSARLALGDFPGCIADYDRALELSPDSITYYNRANARRIHGDLDGALADYDRALAMHPEYPDAWYNRASILAVRGDLDGAVADLTKAIAWNPEYAIAYNERGRIHFLRGRHDDAIADFDRAIRIQPENILPYMNRGLARRENNDPAGALADFDRALEIDPDHVGTLINRGTTRRMLGQLDAALRDLDRAVAIQKDSAEAYATRASIRSLRGDVEGTIGDCRKALELAPANWPYRAVVNRILDEALRK